MSYDSNLPTDVNVTVSTANIRENFRALKDDKIVAAATAVVAESAEKLANARVISLKGDAVGSASFDGSADVTITVDVIDADTVDGLHASDLIAATIPIGGIIMWSGSITAIPDKWALCNGANGTPDLRNKFVLGAGNSYAVGNIGGEATHTLSVSEMPSHSHDMLNLCLRQRPNGPGDSDITVQWNQGFRTSDTGGNQPHNNMPPYYALAYIMRIA